MQQDWGSAAQQWQQAAFEELYRRRNGAEQEYYRRVYERQMDHLREQQAAQARREAGILETRQVAPGIYEVIDDV